MKTKDSIDKELYDRFHNTADSLVIDEERKKETLLFLQKQITDKPIGILSSRIHIFLNQIRYMDKSTTWVHSAICIVLLLIMMFFSRYGVEKENIILISMILSGILGVVTIAEVSRIFFSGIAELSESCYFNVKQIVAFQMLISGIINLTVLFIGILFVGSRWQIHLLQIGLYLLVPFVMAQCCCLRVLLTEAGRRSSFLLVMVGAFLVVFYMILASIPSLYLVASLTLWGIAFLIGLLLMGMQIKALFQGIEKGDILCMN